MPIDQAASMPINRGARQQLTDADLVANDPIAAVILSEAILRAAEASGGPYAVDASAASSGMLQRVFITVR